MIGKLKGLIDHHEDGALLVDVGGVCYHVFTHPGVMAAYGVGDAVELMIETHVREDHIHLYGFSSASERDWFRLLTSVQGVGAKMGLAILGGFTPDQLHMIIVAQDKTQLTAIGGVGPKLAQRITNELKGKTEALLSSSAMVMTLPTAGKTALTDETSHMVNDAVSALVNLGYGRSEAYIAVQSSSAEHDDLDTLIKHALKVLAE